MERISESTRDGLARALERVRERVNGALERAGRPAGAARLVAVTKTVPTPVAAALWELGQGDLGESRPEVLSEKATVLDDAVRWHMIGHFQSRKIRGALAPMSLVHSVHSEELLGRIDRRAAELGRSQPILLQVNVSGEESKQGLVPDGLEQALDTAQRMSSVTVQGLMTMAPRGLAPDRLRGLFAKLRSLRDRQATPEQPLAELSMGMSGDFEEAILEGATLVRVGSALFEGLDPDSLTFKRRPA